jgi:hypothetical protein
MEREKRLKGRKLFTEQKCSYSQDRGFWQNVGTVEEVMDVTTAKLLPSLKTGS